LCGFGFGNRDYKLNSFSIADMKGASGDIKFDKNGIRFPPLVIKKVVDGKMQTVTRLP